MPTHPYISSSGPIIRIIQHLRRSFPNTIDADTLKRLGIAPNNESYLINILRFVGVIDAEGKKTDKASKIFSQHDDQKFQTAFAQLVKDAYSDLFTDHGDDAWKLDNNALITFFRESDESSGIVGGRQASTFRALAALAGFADVPEPKTRSATSKSTDKKRTAKSSVTVQKPAGGSDGGAGAPLGLTVRVEVNLPADANQETYDKIFQSIRKNLIDGR